MSRRLYWVLTLTCFLSLTGFPVKEDGEYEGNIPFEVPKQANLKDTTHFIVLTFVLGSGFNSKTAVAYLPISLEDDD